MEADSKRGFVKAMITAVNETASCLAITRNDFNNEVNRVTAKRKAAEKENTHQVQVLPNV